MFSLKVLQEYINDGWITKRDHSRFPYSIYNYTAKTQFKRKWDDITLNCRGLILDDQCNIIARPFPKFFNLEELPGLGIQIPDCEFKVFDKLDGSLGIMYCAPDGKRYISSRGSFDSEQAIKGTELLRQMENLYSETLDKILKPTNTYLFEIIYPENRIVVDYCSEEKLVLLAAICKQNGTTINPCKLSHLPFEVPQQFPYSYNGIRELINEKNREGFVVVFNNGFRMKIKYQEYVRLHRVVSTVDNEKFIWECLRSKADLDTLVNDIPDELYDEIKKKRNNLLTKYNLVKDLCEYQYKDEFKTRKEAAIYFQQCKYPSIMFAMFDNKSIDQLIWKVIKP